jgi:CO/xanthine dehydrogenase FAD-binding subunit
MLVDVNRLTDLDYVDPDRPDVIALGAGARMSDVADHPVVKGQYAAISESLWRAASQQLRNMASLGGNLLQRTRCGYFRGGAPFPCNKREPGSGCAAIDGLDRGHALFGGSESCIAMYPGDLAVALLTFDAVVDVVGPTGSRGSAPVPGRPRCGPIRQCWRRGCTRCRSTGGKRPDQRGYRRRSWRQPAHRPGCPTALTKRSHLCAA